MCRKEKLSSVVTGNRQRNELLLKHIEEFPLYKKRDYSKPTQAQQALKKGVLQSEKQKFESNCPDMEIILPLCHGHLGRVSALCVSRAINSVVSGDIFGKVIARDILKGDV